MFIPPDTFLCTYWLIYTNKTNILFKKLNLKNIYILQLAFIINNILWNLFISKHKHLPFSFNCFIISLEPQLTNTQMTDVRSSLYFVYYGEWPMNILQWTFLYIVPAAWPLCLTSFICKLRIKIVPNLHNFCMDYFFKYVQKSLQQLLECGRYHIGVSNHYFASSF